MIALMGLDAETGVFMLLFLDLAYDEAKAKGRLRSMADLHEAIVHGAVKRLRPKMMTVVSAMVGLMPIMWSMGTGSEVMKRMAAPMVGGLATSFALESRSTRWPTRRRPPGGRDPREALKALAAFGHAAAFPPALSRAPAYGVYQIGDV